MYYAIMKDVDFSKFHKVEGIKVYGYKTDKEAKANLNFHNQKENAKCYIEKIEMDKQDYIDDLVKNGYIYLGKDLVLYKNLDGGMLVWNVIFEAKESEENGYEESLYLKLMSKSATKELLDK